MITVLSNRYWSMVVVGGAPRALCSSMGFGCVIFLYCLHGPVRRMAITICYGGPGKATVTQVTQPHSMAGIQVGGFAP